MSENATIFAVCILIAGCICAGIFGGIKCSADTNQAIIECVKAGRAPSECKLAMESK